MANPKKTSAYYTRIYEIVRAIPQGKVMTYGGIAALIPPQAEVDRATYFRVRARWVGYAMAACSDDLPWHRVINAQGRISERSGHGPHLQRLLLEQEGMVFDQQGCINLKAYRWEPTTDWLLAHGLLPPPTDEFPPKSSQPRLF